MNVKSWIAFLAGAMLLAQGALATDAMHPVLQGLLLEQAQSFAESLLDQQVETGSAVFLIDDMVRQELRKLPKQNLQKMPQASQTAINSKTAVAVIVRLVKKSKQSRDSNPSSKTMSADQLMLAAYWDEVDRKVDYIIATQGGGGSDSGGGSSDSGGNITGECDWHCKQCGNGHDCKKCIGVCLSGATPEKRVPDDCKCKGESPNPGPQPGGGAK